MHRTVPPLLLFAACAPPLPPGPDGGFVPAPGCWEPNPNSVFVQRLSSPTAGCALQGQPSGVIDLHAANILPAGGVLVVPPSDAGVPLPLVVVFHGAGGTGEDIRSEMQLEGPADGGAIFVYPNAARGTWDIGERTSDPSMVSTLIQRIAGLYCVDPQRLYAAGFSAGAVFTLFLGCNVPDTFRAVGSVAGTDNRFNVSCCQPGLSAIFIHGTADDAIPFASGQGAAGRVLARDQCSSSASPDGAYCSAYACPAGDVVDFCQWSGGHLVPPWAGGELW